LFYLGKLLGVVLRVELTVPSGTATTTSALGPATIVAIVELQWTISLV
jgi:hypothetical protein